MRTFSAVALALAMLPASAPGACWDGVTDGVVPIVTGILGILASAAMFLPLLSRLSEKVKAAKQETRNFLKKYGMVEGSMKRDVERVLGEWDGVLEALADILDRLRMKRAAAELRDLL